MGSSVRSGSPHPLAETGAACRPTLARRAALALAAATLATLALAAPASATTETFNFTGAAQTWIAPAGITEATFDLYGAQGAGEDGGKGGRATATIPVTPGNSIQVNVGGQGSGFTGGFNGGGDGGASGGNIFGGGGASDIRIFGTALTDRVLVAGGGGGAGAVSCDGDPSFAGGDGGGLSGLPGGDTGTGCAFVPGGGGTQTQGGSASANAQPGGFAVGGSGGPGGGGGGGWFGGGGGNGGAGGGGSGHGPAGTVFQTGVQAGNGLVTVTYTPSPPTIATLIRGVVDLNLPLGIEADLLQTLLHAAQALDAGNVNRACHQLGLFVINVHDQSAAGTIPAAAANQLVAEAEAVQGSIGCGAGASTCAGSEATIVGTDTAETLRGTNGDDVIVAGGGGDTVTGLGGDDVVCGGGGADELRGKGGDDTLNGGDGKDELRGGRGSDRCRGGRGSDSKQSC